MIKHVIDVPKFRAWLERQNPNGLYSYICNINCPVALFMRSQGAENIQCGSREITFTAGGVVCVASIPKAIRGALNTGHIDDETFGKALARLDAGRMPSELESHERHNSERMESRS